MTTHKLKAKPLILLLYTVAFLIPLKLPRMSLQPQTPLRHNLYT